MLAFLMGIDLPAVFVILFLFTGFGLGIFFLSRYLLSKVFKKLSSKRIIWLSVLSVWIIVPLIFIGLSFVLVQSGQDENYPSAEDYVESLDEGYLQNLQKGMTKQEVIELVGENDTTKNTMVYDMSLPYDIGHYVLTIEFERNRVVDFARTTTSAE